MTDGSGTISLPAGLEQAVRDAVERRRDDLVGLLRALVRQPSTPGAEAEAQDVVEQWLRDAGFEVERVVPDADAALADRTPATRTCPTRAGAPWSPGWRGRRRKLAASERASTSCRSSARISGSTSRGRARSRTAGCGAVARAT